MGKGMEKGRACSMRVGVADGLTDRWQRWAEYD